MLFFQLPFPHPWMTDILAEFVRRMFCTPGKSREELTSHSQHAPPAQTFLSGPGKARQGLPAFPGEVDDQIYSIRKENIGQGPGAWPMLRVNFPTFEICHIKLSRIKPAVCPIIYNITGNLEGLNKEWKYFSFLRKELASAKIYSNWLGMGMVQRSSHFQGY